jgi:alkylhydroperoxidase/carboxymuconolactone decarboxylase family protein
MELRDSEAALASLRKLADCSLITEDELAAVKRLDSADSSLGQAVRLAETIHLHIKVDDTHTLPVNEFFGAGAQLDHQKDGFVKYRFPGAVNAIFSHIKVSQDELLETESNRRTRPFLDHLGIDLRDETDQVRLAFDALPGIAGNLGWAHASQGGPDKPVYCCHVEVAQKHWLYPPDEDGRPGIPLEFAYGALKVNPGKMGCDLRPANPEKVDPGSIPCCAAEGHGEEAGRRSPAANGAYYQTGDLGRFGEIRRGSPRLAESFFAYYGQAMAEGELTAREKNLIALAVAHALQCPYCIDAYTTTLHKAGVSEQAMSEAVHVAGAMAAGIALVHSVQMMNRLDQFDGQDNSA